MSRKDYIAIARELAEGLPPLNAPADFRHGYFAAMQRVADALAADNALFNRERFIRAASGL